MKPDNNDNGHIPSGGTAYIVGVGTTGCEIAASYHAKKIQHGAEGGISELDCFDTAASSAGISATYVPGQTPIGLPQERIHIFPEYDTGFLAQVAERHPNTRRYARPVRDLPPFKTSTGAAGHRLIAHLVASADLPFISRVFSTRLAALRERRRVASHVESGATVDLVGPIDVFIAGASFGGTMSGMAPIFISEAHRAADRLGLPIRVHVPHVTPSVAVTNDPALAQANYVFFTKEMVKGQVDPASWTFYSLGSGEKITHAPGRSLIHEFTGFGISNGLLTADGRGDAATIVALDIFCRVHSGAGSALESRFCDSKKLILDQTNGLRCLRSVGVQETRVDPSRNKALATLAAQLAIARNLNL